MCPSNLGTLTTALRATGESGLKGAIKKVLINSKVTQALMPGILDLVMSITTMGVSEAVAESVGSILERYHQNRFTKLGSLATDDR